MRVAARSVGGLPVTAVSTSRATTAAAAASVTVATHSAPNMAVRAAPGSAAVLSTDAPLSANPITAAITSSKVVAWSTAAPTLSRSKGTARSPSLVVGTGTATTGTFGATQVALNCAIARTN